MIKNDDDLREFYRGVDSPSDRLLTEWTDRLNAGEEGTTAEGLSRAIILDFILRALLNRPQSKVTVTWLAGALQRILNYEDPRLALRLSKRPRHRPAGARAAKAIDVAWWVKLTIERGYPEAEAQWLAADTFSCDIRDIARLRGEGQEWADGMSRDADAESYFRKKERALPPIRGRSDD